jgi:hypothetical protein
MDLGSDIRSNHYDFCFFYFISFKQFNQLTHAAIDRRCKAHAVTDSGGKTSKFGFNFKTKKGQPFGPCFFHKHAFGSRCCFFILGLLLVWQYRHPKILC